MDSVILELKANFFVDVRATASERVESSSSDDDDTLDFSCENRDSSEIVGSQTIRTLTETTFTKAIAVRLFYNIHDVDTSKK